MVSEVGSKQKYQNCIRIAFQIILKYQKNVQQCLSKENVRVEVPMKKTINGFNA